MAVQMAVLMAVLLDWHSKVLPWAGRKVALLVEMKAVQMAKRTVASMDLQMVEQMVFVLEIVTVGGKVDLLVVTKDVLLDYI